MLGNTQVLTIAGSAKTLTLINQDQYGAEYYLRESTQEFRMKIRHSYAKGDNGQQPRHNVELTRVVFATATTPKYIDKDYRVRQADDGRSTVDLAAALNAWEVASTNAMLTRMEGFES